MLPQSSDIQLEMAGIEHYLFDLGYPIEKVCEIYDIDEESVKEDLLQLSLLKRSLK